MDENHRFLLEFRNAEDMEKAKATLATANIEVITDHVDVFGVTMWQEEDIISSFEESEVEFPTPAQVETVRENLHHLGDLQVETGWNEVHEAVADVLRETAKK